MMTTEPKNTELPETQLDCGDAPKTSQRSSGIRGWARSHLRATLAISGVLAVTLIAGTTFAGITINDQIHENAKRDYAAAIATARTHQATDSKARNAFVSAQQRGHALNEQATGLHANSDGLVDGVGHEQLAETLTKLDRDLSAKPGRPATLPKATAPSSSADFRAAEANTTRLVAKHLPELKRTTDATNRVGAAITNVNQALTAIALSLPGVSEVVAAAHPNADEAARTSFDASRNAVAEAATAKDPVIDALAEYVAQARNLVASHEAAVAIVAQDPRAASASDAPTGAKSPSAAKGSPSSGGSSNGGAPAGGSGSSGNPGGGAGGGGAQPIDHTPRVTANGEHRPGCVGALMYTQSTTSGGGIIINVDYAYKYETFSTDTGWGLRVYICKGQ